MTLRDPETFEPRCYEVQLPESVVARLSADGNALYAVGVSTVYRYQWDGRRLECDLAWRYSEREDQSYGWDPGDRRRAALVSRQRRARLRLDDARRGLRARTGAPRPPDRGRL